MAYEGLGENRRWVPLTTWINNLDNEVSIEFSLFLATAKAPPN